MCAMLRDLSARLLTLQDHVRQLYGALLIKLAKRKSNHSTLVAEGCIGLGVALLDTFDAEIKAPLLFDELGAGSGGSDFAGLNSSLGLPGFLFSPPRLTVAPAAISYCSFLCYIRTSMVLLKL